jgi:uncharacterized SAM-binding protein YcdF (DUF218 family)
MNLPASNLPVRRKKLRRKMWSVLFLVLLLVALAWSIWLYGQIRLYSTWDQAQSADAIAIFGAAEYDGHPSPVLRARLDHGLALYQRGLAPLVITLGGPGDEGHTEGEVGHDYLLAHGVPEGSIIAETLSSNTEESARRLAAIARTNQLHRIVIVSDGTHLFRIHALCAAEGLDVYGSPRPQVGNLEFFPQLQRYLHEILSYTAWRLHLH